MNHWITVSHNNWIVYKTVDVNEKAKKNLYLEINRKLKGIQKQTPSTSDKVEILSTTI